MLYCLRLYDRIYFYIAVIAMTLLSAFPQDFYYQKLFIVAILFFLSFPDFLNKKKQYLKFVLFWSWIVYIVFSFFISVNNGYEFDYKLMEIYILNPFVAIVVASKLRNYDFDSVLYIASAMGVFILIINLIYVLALFGFFDIRSFMRLSQYGSLVYNGSKLEMRVVNQSALILLGPLTFYYFVLKEKYLWQAIILLLFALVALVSGRRALQVSAIILILFEFFPLLRNCSSVRKIVYVVLFFLLIGAFADLSIINDLFYSAYSTFSSGFEFDTTANIKRAISIQEMYSLFNQSPLFGVGVAGHDLNYIRNENYKWSYEVVYHALMAQIGLVGVLFFFSVVLILVLGIRNNVAKNYDKFFATKLSLFFLTFFILGSTNPLIYYLWLWVFMFVLQFPLRNIRIQKVN